jgi:hypothetical protein
MKTQLRRTEMTSTLRRTLAGLALVTTLTLAVALLYMPSASALQSTGGRIDGTWRVQVTLRNCQSGAELRTFPAILTFANGGTLTGTSTVLSPGLRSPDHGIWEHTGGQNYRAVDEAFIFNPAGVWVSTQRLTQSIELAGKADSFTSNANTEFFDTAGNVTATGCATAVAARME